MSVLLRPCLAALALALASLASAGDAPPLPSPQVQPQTVRVAPGRNMVTAFEVESLSFVAGDPAGLAAWAELAVRGYHVVGTLLQDGKTLLFFERNIPPNTNTSELSLPAAMEKDPAMAAEVRGRLLGVLAERRVAARPAPQAPPAK